MPNVVLINPRTSSSRLPYKEKYAAREPLGILAIGSFLQSYGHKVRIVDTHLYSDDEVKEKLKSLMIGIPGQSKEEMRSNIYLMNQINEICPNAVHTTNWIFRPLPGGELYDNAKSSGLKEPVALLQWASFGVDKEDNTGSYSVYELPWIEDPQFVEFLAIFTPRIRSTSTGKLRVKAYFISKILKFIYKTWDWIVFGYFSKKIGNLVCRIYDRRHYSKS